MTRVETHEKDCPVCQSGYKDHCYDREAAEFLDELQAAVEGWSFPLHRRVRGLRHAYDGDPLCPACLGGVCCCGATAEQESRAKARKLLGIDP